MAQLIPRASRVLEFGAGRRHLESCLDPSCVYLPCDLIDRGPGTVICDLNKRPLPDLRYLRPDVVFLAGVLEYMTDLPSLVIWLSGLTLICVTSYDCTQLPVTLARRLRERYRRVRNGYMNHATEEELLGIFERSGFVCIRKDTWQNQRLFVFENQIGKVPRLTEGED